MIQSVIHHLRFLGNPNFWTLSALDEPIIPEDLWPDFLKELNAADGSVLNALNRWSEERKTLTAQGIEVLKMLNDVNDPLYALKAYTLPVTLESILSLAGTAETERELQAFRELSRKLMKKTGNNLNVFLDLLSLTAQEETEYSEHRNFVHLLTLHGSKGRQFKKVFIAGVTASNIPNPKSDLEEERRLLYVGITRAMEELIISYYRSSFGHAEEPSPFVTEMLKSPVGHFLPDRGLQKEKKAGVEPLSIVVTRSVLFEKNAKTCKNPE